MRTNFFKSESIPMNLDEDNMHCIAHHFYLGAHLHYEELGREDIQPSIDSILKRIAVWRVDSFPMLG
jgi:hypothetical protein